MTPRTDRTPFARNEPSRRPAVHFERAVIADMLSALTVTRGAGPISAAEIAKQKWPDDAATPRLLTRGAVSPANTTTPSWAGSLAAESVGDWVASLAPSAAAKLINAGMKVSFAGRADLKIPRRSSTLGANVAFVSEGSPLAVKNFSLDSITLYPYKLACVAVLSRTVAISSSGEQVVTAMLREDVANKLDSAVFGTAAASAGLNPAGLLNGVSPLTATTGADQNAMLRDLERLAGAKRLLL